MVSTTIIFHYLTSKWKNLFWLYRLTMFHITQILHNALFSMSINPCNSEKIPTCANLTLEKLSYRKNENIMPFIRQKNIKCQLCTMYIHIFFKVWLIVIGWKILRTYICAVVARNWLQFSAQSSFLPHHLCIFTTDLYRIIIS